MRRLMRGLCGGLYEHTAATVMWWLMPGFCGGLCGGINPLCGGFCGGINPLCGGLYMRDYDLMLQPLRTYSRCGTALRTYSRCVPIDVADL